MDPSSLTTLVETQRSEDPDQSFGFHSWVSIDRKFLCMTIPKVACSRVKLTLLLLEGTDAPDDLGKVHQQGKRLSDFETSQIQEMFTSPEWFRFCFDDRLISAYNTQVGNSWNDEYDWLIEEIKSEIGYTAGRDHLVPFRDFVHAIRDARDRIQRDGHFNIQSRVLMPDLIKYDFVGRFETFEQDFSTALERLGAPPAVVASAAEVVNRTYSVQPPLVYDRTLADTVYDMYAPDFERYGYDRDSWMLERR